MITHWCLYDAKGEIIAAGYADEWHLSGDQVHPSWYQRTANKCISMLTTLAPNGGVIAWEDVPQYVKAKTSIWPWRVPQKVVLVADGKLPSEEDA